jgi:hypothetical protein
MPAAAPEPARPIKCSLPMLLANNDAPTCSLTEHVRTGGDRHNAQHYHQLILTGINVMKRPAKK